MYFIPKFRFPCVCSDREVPGSTTCNCTSATSDGAKEQADTLESFTSLSTASAASELAAATTSTNWTHRTCTGQSDCDLSGGERCIGATGASKLGGVCVQTSEECPLSFNDYSVNFFPPAMVSGGR